MFLFYLKLCKPWYYKVLVKNSSAKFDTSYYKEEEKLCLER